MPAELVEVAFKGNRTGIYTNPVEIQLKTGDNVIVETDRGEDLGEVVAIGRVLSLKDFKGEPLKVMRLATPENLKKLKENRLEEEKAFRVCKEKIAKRNLNMKLVDVEYQFDRNKLIFYFTSDQRRQIGVRDEAKRIGGYGTCGYRYATKPNESAVTVPAATACVVLRLCASSKPFPPSTPRTNCCP
ncbi:hypothetical protein B1H10_08265 [candidate division KSB1 bacterium 4484_188]|nr:MAG: hypothetical protein B1H10_08265 [candidate division KSB1 bacterium 4484_188]